MLWVCDHYVYFYSFSAGIDFRRQNLTSTDIRFWRLKSIPALKGLKWVKLLWIIWIKTTKIISLNFMFIFLQALFEGKIKKLAIDVIRALTLSVRGPTLDVRFWRRQILTSKVDRRNERGKIFIMAVDPDHNKYSHPNPYSAGTVRFWRQTYIHNIFIQLKRKELTKTCMMISNWNNPLVSMVYMKKNQRFKT